MFHLFQAYPIQVAIRYDQLFHQAAARDPLLRWATFKEDLLVWCSTRRSFRAPISSRLGPPTHRPNSGLSTPVTTNTNGSFRRTHTEGGAKICKHYNLRNCTRGEECKFTHACWNAGCRALHSVMLWAALCLAFYGFLRGREFTTTCWGTLNPAIHARRFVVHH